jgi:hypothetical protein
MPEEDQSYNIRFQSDVQDYVAKSDAVIRKTNEVSEALERMKSTAQGGKGGPTSPFRAQLTNEIRELNTMQSAGFYSPQLIEKQQRKVDELRKKDRAYEERLYKEELNQEAEKHKKKQQAERDLEKEAKAWQTYHKNVRKEESDRAKEHEKNLKNRERREKEYLQNIGGKIAVFQTMMNRIGLGGIGGAMGRGAMSVATIASALGLGTIGVGLGLGVGAIGAAGLSAGGMMLYGARQGLMRNPARQRELEMAQYVNPAEAMENTRPLLKAEAAWKKGMEDIYQWSAKKVGDIGVKVIETGMKGYTLGLEVKNRLGSLISGKPTADFRATGFKMAEDWAKDVKETPTIGEIRYWLDDSRTSLSKQNLPTNQMAQMGLYATSSEAIRINRQDITQTEMINAMKELTKKMSDLADKGLFGDIGGGGKPITRT